LTGNRSTAIRLETMVLTSMLEPDVDVVVAVTMICLPD